MIKISLKTVQIILISTADKQSHTIFLTFTTLWANSADDKLVIFFLFFPENRIWHFMQIVSIVDNLLERSIPVFREKHFKCHLLKIYPECWGLKKCLTEYDLKQVAHMENNS